MYLKEKKGFFKESQGVPLKDAKEHSYFESSSHHNNAVLKYKQLCRKI